MLYSTVDIIYFKSKCFMIELTERPIMATMPEKL